MDRAVVSALSAILGSLVGGTATIATAWLTQRTQTRRATIDNEIRKREMLYAEFITEASKVLVDALDHKIDDLHGLYGLYAILNRIRLVASDQVLVEADHAATLIVERCFAPALSQEQLQQLLLTRASDPLAKFSQACRVEIQGLQRGS